MVGIDTNVLIDLLVESQPDHQKSTDHLKKIKEPLAICTTNVSEVLRLLTHPQVFSKPLRMQQAIELLQSWIEVFEVEILQEPEDFLDRLKTVVKEEISDLIGNEVFDAKIAITLYYCGVRRIWTKDSDFKKYSFLEVI